jgi:hypothetical protein
LGDGAADYGNTRTDLVSPRRRAADEKAGMRRFIQIYFYHTECNKSATNFERIVRNNTPMYVQGCANPIK